MFSLRNDSTRSNAGFREGSIDVAALLVGVLALGIGILDHFHMVEIRRTQANLNTQIVEMRRTQVQLADKIEKMMPHVIGGSQSAQQAADYAREIKKSVEQFGSTLDGFRTKYQETVSEGADRATNEAGAH